MANKEQWPKCKECGSFFQGVTFLDWQKNGFCSANCKLLWSKKMDSYQSFPVHSEILKCSWTAIRPVSERGVAIDVPELNSTDMRGAIDFSKSVLPLVDEITVFRDGLKDIVYSKTCAGWQSKSYRQD